MLGTKFRILLKGKGKGKRHKIGGQRQGNDNDVIHNPKAKRKQHFIYQYHHFSLASIKPFNHQSMSFSLIIP